MPDFSNNVSLPDGAIQNLGYMIGHYDLPKSVMNFFDWQNLCRNSKSFAAFNAFGEVTATMPVNPDLNGNYKFYFNKPTGFLTEYHTGSDFELIIDSLYSSQCDLAANTDGTVDGAPIVHPVFKLDTIKGGSVGSASAANEANIAAALGLMNIHIREGLGFYVIGGLYDSNGALTGQSCGFAFVGKDNGHMLCELMDSSIPSSGTPKNLVKISGAVTILVTDYAEFDGAAPAADDMGTTQSFNFLQMFDATIGKGYSEQSQGTYFDNKFEGLFPPLRTMEQIKYNTQLLFGMKGAAPTQESPRGATMGIWGLMKLHNPTAWNGENAKPAIQVDNGTTLDYWKLYKFIEQRPTYVNKNMLCITTPQMGVLLKQAAAESRDLDRVPGIEFPNVPGDTTYSFKIGDTTLHCITDNILQYHPLFKDYAGNTATQSHVMLMLDMRYCGIKYQNNAKLGLMIPQIDNIDPINRERKDRAHMFSCWGTAMWNPQMHAFYGLNTAA